MAGKRKTPNPRNKLVKARNQSSADRTPTIHVKDTTHPTKSKQGSRRRTTMKNRPVSNNAQRSARIKKK